MVQASFTWVSFLAVLLVLYAVPASFLSLAKYNSLTTSSSSPSSSFRRAWSLILVTGRSLGILISASILIFQSWRLDPLFQVVYGVLVIGLMVESFSNLSSDMYRLVRRMSSIAKSGV